ncbi:putative ras-2 protein [Botrytis fragariae]|uniref:Putative ras-2 protein n=1 Tax=Botrytis fragariae TaxID=1964551 RepID=A0A8H6B1P3_9HELO|nr:putative ras-2 protein [Botrytis fragariae]KAF5877525.1 putative ras-2 protein [Botrytis fragariae]
MERTENIWIESYDPTIEDSYRKVIEVDVSILRFLLRLGMEVETHDHDANATF